MIKNPYLYKSRKSYSFQFRYDFLNRNDLLFSKKPQDSNLNHESEKNVNKYGFAFSMGLKVLKGNYNDNNRRKSKSIKKFSSLIKNNIINPSRTLRRQISRPVSEKSINKYINQRNEFINKSFIKDQETSKVLYKLYYKYIDNIEPKIIKKLKEVDKCSILKYGIKPSTEEISYSYCITCDCSLINPICIPCLKYCHGNHTIKENYEIGKIICSCGERSHIISNARIIDNKNIINDCLFNELSKISKLNICYINNNSKLSNDNICLLCYHFCQYDKTQYSPSFFELKNGDDYPKCTCVNKQVHNDIRFFLKLLEEMTSNYKKIDGLNLLHPTQLVNAFINSDNSFQYNCKGFIQLFNAIKSDSFNTSPIYYSLSKVDFYSTNCFIIIKIFINIISFNNHTNISYYSEKIENYFSFEIIQKITNNLKNSNLKENTKWILSYEFLKLFRKVYIGNKTQIFDKYKLEDLDNFSACQRFFLFYQNEKVFPLIQEIITFLLNYLQDINIIGFKSVEALPCIGEIFGILKKLSILNMLSNNDIIKVLQEIIKFFSNLNILRNYLKLYNENDDSFKNSKIERRGTNGTNSSLECNYLYSNNIYLNNSSIIISESEDSEIKLNHINFFKGELSLYYTFIKMIRIFYINYSDRLVHNFLIDKIKQRKNDDYLNHDNLSFGYMKNEFGREIFKITIKILYIINKFSKNKDNINKDKNKSKYQKIIYHGIKILEYSLVKKDSYLISLIRSFINGEFYIKKLNILLDINSNNKKYKFIDNNYNNSKVFNLLVQEKNNLEKYNKLFLNFKINKIQLITYYNKSLDSIFNDQYKDKKIRGFNDNLFYSILKSKYFFTISKIFRILFFFDEIISDKTNIISMKSKQEINNIEKNLMNELTSKILFFYNNFIFQSSDNSLLVLSHYIFNDLTKMPIIFSVDNFLLFHSCLENISGNNKKIENIINNAEHYLKNLYYYLEYLHKKKYSEINICLLIFLKCFYILSINIKSADYEIFIKIIRKILIKVNTIFNIANTYFKYDEDRLNEIIRNIEIENKYKITDMNNGINNNNMNENINIDNFKKKNNDDKIDKNTLEEILIIDLHLINDFFDFELNEQKQKLLKIIDVQKVIYSLKFQNIIHLTLRTQMIRYVRKILIDMNYKKEYNYIYVNSIINNEDTLSILKNNPLVNNYKYPTKLISFAKDFWNLSIKPIYDKKIFEELKEEKSEYNNSIESSDESDYSSSSGSIKINYDKYKMKRFSIFNDKTKDKIKEVKEDEEEITSNDNRNFIHNSNSNKENINKKNLVKCFDIEFYDLLINELNNINDILRDVNTSSNDDMEALGEYFQSGLLIPIIFFFKKYFALANYLTGTEFIKLYDLAVKSIYLKITISELKYNFWNDNNNNVSNFEDDLFSTHMLNIKKDFMINGTNFRENDFIKKSNRTLKSLKSKNFSCFDYTLLYNIVDKNLFCLINDYNQNSLKELFSEKKDDINLQFLNKSFSTKYNNNSNINEKIYKIYLFYKNNKNFDANNSSLLKILPEICTEYETSYRALLINILISDGIKLSINNNNNTYSISLYFLLYKLLSLHTSKTQSEITNLLGAANNDDNNKNNNLGFMSIYSQHLMERIILLFIQKFNPNDKYYNDNFIFIINLVKIFKYLCEEHNNFFQMRLIKILNFKYINVVPKIFQDNKNFKNYQGKYKTKNESKSNSTSNSNLSNEKLKIKKINFFDFFLYSLLKISIVSGWDRLKEKKNVLNKNKYLYSRYANKNIYDLFSSIIEMLNEIIQGNKEENLIKLGNPFFNYEDNTSYEEENEYNDLVSMEVNFNDKKETEINKISQIEKSKLKKRMYRKLKIKKDPFSSFIRGMVDFIFIDNINNQVLYQLRNDLMQFFTSILEEKNCNEEIQKLIIKYININRIFNSISSILKNYILSRIPPDSLPDDFIFEKNRDSKYLTMENLLIQKISSSQKTINLDIIREKENKNYNSRKTIAKIKDNQINKNNYLNINLLKEKLIFDHRLLNYYYEQFYSNKEFYLSIEFQLTNTFYRYIKLIAVLEKNEELKTIIKDAKSTSINNSIKKFEPNIINIKREYTNNYNNKNIKTQLRLSKSIKTIRYKKTMNLEKMKNKQLNFETNKSTKTKSNHFISVQLSSSKSSEKKSDNFLNSIYSSNKLIHNFSLIKKEKNNKEDIYKTIFDNKKKNIFKTNFIDNSDSSERILGNDNKDINLGNNMNDKIIKNKIFNDFQKYKRINLNDKRNRYNVFFKVNEKKNKKYPLILNNTKDFYDKDYIERFYIVKFFESIISTVEVRNEESKIQTVIFTHLPEMIYLSNSSKDEFEKKVNRDSEINKKNDLIRHLEYFHKEIEYYKNNYSPLLHFVSKINYYYIKWINYIYAFLLNLLVLFTISGDNQISLTNENSYDVIKVRRNDIIGIEKKINASIKNWEDIYNILNYIYLILNGIVIIIWLYFRLPLYYEIDKIKYFEENNNKKALNIKDKLYIIIIMTIYKRNYISTLIYEFVISLISSFIKREEIIFPFFLLAIVDLNITLKNVIISIQLRHKEFTLCFFLSFIFIYVLSNIAFFYYNDDYKQELDYYNDNVCKSLIFCVLNSLDSGLRARGGLGDSAIRISFMRHKSHYIERLILDDIFFFFIVIISIDLVFGIIIGEFAALREKTQKHDNDRKYHCLICHINKNTVEKNRQNFSVHINNKHNLWNYVSYMIYVKLSNSRNLNSINSYVKDKIDNKNISWLPSYKDFINKEQDNKTEEDEIEDFIIEEENITHNYVIKPT